MAIPFAYPELRARVDALLRRATARRAPAILRDGALRIDLRTRRAWIGTTEIPVSGKEYELLVTLAREPERVFNGAELLRSVWGHGPTARTRTVDSHAARLRSRLAVGGGRWVNCVWGIGYRLSDPIRAVDY